MIRNYIHDKVCDEITYPFPNFNNATFEVWEWISKFIPAHYLAYVIPYNYRKTSHISRILVGNKIVDISDVVGASPVGAAPTTSSFSTQHLASMDGAKTTSRLYKKHLNFGIRCDLY